VWVVPRSIVFFVSATLHLISKSFMIIYLFKVYSCHNIQPWTWLSAFSWRTGTGRLVPSGTWSGGRPNTHFCEGYSCFSPFNCWVIFFLFFTK
jgi:hypothetical protein